MQIQRKGRPGRQATSGDKDHPQKRALSVSVRQLRSVDGKVAVEAELTFMVG